MLDKAWVNVIFKIVFNLFNFAELFMGDDDEEESGEGILLLTLQLPLVTKIEFFLTISIQYQAD